MTTPELWLDWRRPKSNANAISSEIVSLITRVVVSAESPPLPQIFQALPRFEEDTVTSELFDVSSSGRNLVGAAIDITSPEAQQQATSLVGCVHWLQLSCQEWTMIPAENLISVADGSPTKICVRACEPSQIQGLVFALQLGVDALLLEARSELWDEAKTVQEKKAREAQSNKSTLENESDEGNSLSLAEVVEVVEGGVGDRVCLDLIQTLKEGEGCLVGSSAKALVLVHAETFSSGFVPARPFRINAGPVHSYVLMGDGVTTKYLCEVQAGDQVLVMDYRGDSKSVTVGRCKIEPRPMLLVKFKKDESLQSQVNQIFLQQAETVRLLVPAANASKDGIGDSRNEDNDESILLQQRTWFPLPVTSVKKGDIIFISAQTKGTHLGQKITAKVIET